VTTPAPNGPTVRRLVVGVQLRRLRERASISRERAGFEIRGSESKISRLELGRVGFKERDIVDLLQLYGVTGQDEVDALLNLAREANEPGWWHSYDDVLPTWFQTYVGLEESAKLIRVYELQFVPGLLQTEDYARAVVTAGRAQARDEEIERRVKLRLDRQRIIHRADGPAVWAIVDEAALRRPMGGRRVMFAQIEYLLELTEQPNVTIQVMPFRFGGHAAQGGAFTILRFAEPDLADIVYVEQLTTALYLDRPDQVDRYIETMERLSAESQPPEETRDALRRIVKQN
jgi:transcriptional regulator with XRE-family HTH domain